MQMHGFRLVQRLDPNTRPAKGWFGHKFELDYMGSSEFEYGAQHDSLERMQKAGDLTVVTAEITRKGVARSVFCITNRAGLDQKLIDFEVWASQDRLFSKESTYFDLLFDENFEWIKREYIRVVAWWSLHDDFLWTLDEEIARQLLHGLKNPVVAGTYPL